MNLSMNRAPLAADLLRVIVKRGRPVGDGTSETSRTKRGRRLSIAALAGLAAAIPAGQATEFLALGDVPYSTAEFDELERLLAHAADRKPAFIVHVGDIKAGSQACTTARDRQIAALFAAQSAPVLYTPGDNEWTDCHRAATGERDPLARLQALRDIFFADPQILHNRALRPEVPDAAFPENRWFTQDRTVFAIIHVVGSNNGLDRPDPPSQAMFRARTAANRNLLRMAARAARSTQAEAMVIIFHANPWFERNPPAVAFAPLFEDLKATAERYTGPILVIHGDTHRYRFDQPWQDAEFGNRLWRLEVPGSPFVSGVWVGVHPTETPIFEAAPVTAPPPAGR